MANPTEPNQVYDIVVSSKRAGRPYRVYRTVQAAVDAYHPGETVWVDPGIYTETVDVPEA